MTTYRLILPGETPSLKNSKRIVVAGDGKRRVIASATYKTWAKAIIGQLKRCQLVGHAWRYPVIVDFHFYRTTRRKFDYVNLCQGPLDLLVEAGILADDDMECVIPGQWNWSIDKDNPRVELTIREIT